MTSSRKLASVAVGTRWGDMDAFNHVNNSVYATYIEEARLRWLHDIKVRMDDDAAPVLASMKIDFRKPVEWPAELRVELFSGRVGRSSITMGFRIIDRHDDSVLYCEGETVLVWIAPSTGTSIALPDAVRNAMTG